MTNKYQNCPLKEAGFTLHHFDVLGAVVIGPDHKCICTVDKKCKDTDKTDGQRCTLEHLNVLDYQARCRRTWQSGGDYYD